MEVVSTAALMTAEEFLALAERSSASRSELIDGELVMSEASWMHNGVQMAIAFALRDWARGGGRGSAGLPLDVQLDGRNVHAPDVVWYREGRAPQRDDLPPYAVPDLAVEVRSPSTWRYDIGRKKSNYEQHGVCELWLVDTAANVVDVFRRSTAKAPGFDVCLEFGAGDAVTSPLLPGFALAVDEIFELD
jgi:Uma2 family endonuclease